MSEDVVVDDRLMIGDCVDFGCPYRLKVCFLDSCEGCGNNFDWSSASKKIEDYLEKQKLKKESMG